MEERASERGKMNVRKNDRKRKEQKQSNRWKKKAYWQWVNEIIQWCTRKKEEK